MRFVLLQTIQSQPKTFLTGLEWIAALQRSHTTIAHMNYLHATDISI